MNESDLTARAAARDSAAFGALVRMHQSSLRGFLLRLTRGDRPLADDLAQETFLEAFRKIAQFRGDGSFAGWLYRIAWSRFLMQARRRREESVEGLEAAEATPHPEEAAGVSPMNDELDDLLSQPLPAIADDGFSARVMARIAKQEWLRSMLSTAALLLCALALLLLVPVSGIEDALARLAPAIAASLPLSIAAGAIAFSLSVEQLVRRR